MESESTHYENDQMKERSNICPQLTANDSTLLKAFQDCLEITSNPNKRKRPVIHESARTSKKRILNDNANTSNNDTRIREKIFYPFWTDASKELSSKLWLPEGIDYVNIKSDSWFSVQMCKIPIMENWPKICYELLPPDITVCEPYLTNLTRVNENKKKQTKTGKQQKNESLKMRKIRLYPNTEQQAILKRWMGTSRWTYNQSLRIYKSGVKDLKLVRKLVINKENFENDKDKCWVLKTPSSIRDNAFLEFKKNLKTELKKKRKFVMKFKSKKYCKKDQIRINVRDYDREEGQFSFLKKIKKSEAIDMKNKNEIIISRDKLNMYYLHVPIPLSIRNEKEGGII
ncbi:6182_t:CDS:1, partial [Gigaspora rosea]